jgi:predicted lipase
MGMELIEDALGDDRNAQFLAVASELSYLNEPEGPQALRSHLGLDARLIQAGNTQVYLGQNDQHIVVAFRGTESPTSIEGLKDWLLTDAMNLLIVPEGRWGTDFAAAGVGARFHKGFVDALMSVWEPLEAGVTAEVKRADRPLWITGHSLGGALAVLAAWIFKRKFVQVHQIYTFGGPMVGNAEAREALDRELPNRIYRYVNPSDPVPLLPTISLMANDYCHCLKEMELGVIVQGAGSALDLFRTLAGKTVDGLLRGSLLDDCWTAIGQRISSHGMDYYKGLLAERMKARG